MDEAQNVKRDACALSIDEFELTVRAQSGDKQAFDEIDRRYRNKIAKYLRSRVGASDVAEDLTQDVFERAFVKLHGLKNGVFLSGWLFKIAYSVFIDWFRKKSKRTAHIPYDESAEASESTDVIVNAVDSVSSIVLGGSISIEPSEIAARSEERENLWRIARDSLSSAEFKTIWMKYAERASDSEIAESLGISLGAVRSTATRARNKLVAKLKPFHSQRAQR